MDGGNGLFSRMGLEDERADLGMRWVEVEIDVGFRMMSISSAELALANPRYYFG